MKLGVRYVPNMIFVGLSLYFVIDIGGLMKLLRYLILE